MYNIINYMFIIYDTKIYIIYFMSSILYFFYNFFYLNRWLRWYTEQKNEAENTGIFASIPEFSASLPSWYLIFLSGNISLKGYFLISGAVCRLPSSSFILTR